MAGKGSKRRKGENADKFREGYDQIDWGNTTKKEGEKSK